MTQMKLAINAERIRFAAQLRYIADAIDRNELSQSNIERIEAATVFEMYPANSEHHNTLLAYHLLEIATALDTGKKRLANTICYDLASMPRNAANLLDTGSIPTWNTEHDVYSVDSIRTEINSVWQRMTTEN